jgi:hypothetical protein
VAVSRLAGAAHAGSPCRSSHHILLTSVCFVAGSIRAKRLTHHEERLLMFQAARSIVADSMGAASTMTPSSAATHGAGRILPSHRVTSDGRGS